MVDSLEYKTQARAYNYSIYPSVAFSNGQIVTY